MEKTNPSCNVHRLQPGCTAHYLEAFKESLTEAGYRPLTVDSYIWSAMHFGGWLDRHCISLQEVDDRTLDLFADHHCDCPGGRREKWVSRRYAARAKRFVDYLRKQGVARSSTDPPDENMWPHVDDFRLWLLQERGLSKRTVDRYERLLVGLLPTLGWDPAVYDVRKIRQTILEEVQRCSRAQAKTVVTTLRAYLRFLATGGHCRPSLESAVPTVPEWRLSSLPRYLDEHSVERLIDSCDVNTRIGLRDRSVLLFLARMGLRAGDIVGMRFDDIDWDKATLRVRGKGRREVSLPLPQDVGDALLEYVQKARPKVAMDRVYLCAQAPYRPFRSGSMVSEIVRAALRRAGIKDSPSGGANLLRHSFATMMLRSGAALDEIAALLRHRSTETTAHYAKVDIEMLRGIAQPWPEGTPC